MHERCPEHDIAMGRAGAREFIVRSQFREQNYTRVREIIEWRETCAGVGGKERGKRLRKMVSDKSRQGAR